MTRSLLRVLMALILVFNGVSSVSAMVKPCHGTQAAQAAQAAVNAQDVPAHHAGHGLHEDHIDLPTPFPLPCDGACCDGLACPSHASALIVPQAAAVRVAQPARPLIDQRLTTTDPVLRPLVPPYRPPAS